MPPNSGKAALGFASETRPQSNQFSPDQDTAMQPNSQGFARRPICRDCFYFRPMSYRDALMSGRGECNRFPPQTCPACLSLDDGRPIVDAADWCGEFVHRDDIIDQFDPATQSIMRRRGDGR